MRGLSSFLFLFRNEFNKYNNTRARMLDSIYHMTNTFKSHFWRKNVMILSSCTQRCYGRNYVSRKSINLWKGFSDEIPCVQFSICFLRLQFYFVNYVIVSCELPYYNSFDHRMLLKN